MADLNPESIPPSQPNPRRVVVFDSNSDYLRYVAERLDGHTKGQVIGREAKRDVGIAAMILRLVADDWEEESGAR